MNKTNLRNDLLTAYQEGNLLEVVHKKSLGGEGNHNDFVEELVKLHNENSIDAIAAFKGLQNGASSDFFSTRYILEESLPKLNAPVHSVMECVLHLVKESGQDTAANLPFSAFTDFCAAAPSRPKEALSQIKSSTGEFYNFLTSTLVAGTRIDADFYLKQAIQLSEHEDIEIRKRAIFSLGRIQYPDNSNLSKLAFTCLESSGDKETDDSLLGNLIISAFSLYQCDKSQEKFVTELINKALLNRGDYVLHAASELFGSHCNELPNTLLNTILLHLLHVKSKNKRTLEYIDYGLVKLIKSDSSAKGIEFIEKLLLTNPEDLSLSIFDNFTRELANNKDNILNKLMTKWFLLGDKVLCEGIEVVVEHDHKDDMLLVAEQSELLPSGHRHIIFLARKAIGYLFSKPVTAASIIISLIQYANEDNPLQDLIDLLSYSLLINYPVKVGDYLKQQVKNQSEKEKAAIESMLKIFDDYLNDLKSTGEISELHPSQVQRDTYHQHFSRQVSEAYKKAQKESPFFSIFQKSVLLYGENSIHYGYDHDGQFNRTKFPLHTHSAQVEIPRLHNIDPFGLDYMLRVFKVERIKQ